MPAQRQHVVLLLYMSADAVHDRGPQSWAAMEAWVRPQWGQGHCQPEREGASAQARPANYSGLRKKYPPPVIPRDGPQ